MHDTVGGEDLDRSVRQSGQQYGTQEQPAYLYAATLSITIESDNGEATHAAPPDSLLLGLKKEPKDPNESRSAEFGIKLGQPVVIVPELYADYESGGLIRLQVSAETGTGDKRVIRASAIRGRRSFLAVIPR